MINRRQFIQGTAVSMLLMPGLSDVKVLAAADKSLDVAYINGHIWTGTILNPITDALGTVGKYITALGKAEVEANSSPKTRVVDLQGSFITPGFIDNHTHFLMASQALQQINLLGAKTKKDFVNQIGEFASKLKSGQWLQGGKWDEQRWGGELPRKEWVDAVTGDVPIVLSRTDLHSFFVNTIALKLAGIDRNTPDPDGGVIVRDSKGEPTGILKDKAKDLVSKVIPAPSHAEIETSFRHGIEHGLSLGVTQSHIKALDWISQDALVRLRAKGETDMRFSSFVPIQDWERLHNLVKEQGRGDDWVRWGGVKGLVDGSLGASTALFKEPYSDDPNNRGIPFVDPSDLRQWILDADRHHLQVAVHAIGDQANSQLLDVYAEAIKINGRRDRRSIIEHVQHIDPVDFNRFAELGVIASMQPYHASDDGRWAEKRIGKERLLGTYAAGSLMRAGAIVSFGSDWPVAPFDPLTGLKAAVLRQTIDGANPNGWLPYEKMSLELALRAYTVTNAYAGFQESRLGQLEKGFLADFVIFEDNLLTLPAEQLTSTKVSATVVNGVCRYGELC